MLWNTDFNEIVLSQIPDASMRESLKNFLEEENLDIRRLLAGIFYPHPYHEYCESIINAIAASSHPESSKIICQFYADTIELRYYVYLGHPILENIKYLWHRKPEKVLASILPYLDASSEVRDDFSRVIADLGDPNNASYILPLLEDTIPRVQYIALSSLARLKSADTALPVLAYLQKVSAPPWETDNRGLEAARTLWAIGNLDTILTALQDKNQWVRYNLVSAEGRIYDHRAIPILYNALNDSLLGVRCFAVRNLGYLCDVSVFPDLLKLLNNEHEHICKAVIDALLYIDEVEAFPHVIPAIHNYTSYRTELWFKLEHLENQTVALQLRELLLEYPEIQQLEEKIKQQRKQQ